MKNLAYRSIVFAIALCEVGEKVGFVIKIGIPGGEALFFWAGGLRGFEKEGNLFQDINSMVESTMEFIF
jgi:hypothetical protein